MLFISCDGSAMVVFVLYTLLNKLIRKMIVRHNDAGAAGLTFFSICFNELNTSSTLQILSFQIHGA